MTCIKKVDRHTWYITARQVVFALWSKRVDVETKAEMARRLLDHMKEDKNEEVTEVVEEEGEEEEAIASGKPDLPRIYDDSTLPDFIGDESVLLFKVINSDFVFSHILRDFIVHYVSRSIGRSVHWLVGWSITL